MADPGWSVRATPPPTAQDAAESAVRAVGCGYDLTDDLRLFCVKTSPGRLLDLSSSAHSASSTRDLSLPGGAVVQDVPAGIVADKGERARFRSDALPFAQMAEQVNQSMLSLPPGTTKIPSGPFNAMFDYRGCWRRDAAATRTLCFDARLVELYAVEAPRAGRLALREEVARDVLCSWDPAALATFAEKYGTHVIVGVRMGGKDVVCVKQLRGSALTPRDMQARLKKHADDVFSQDRRRESSSAAKSGGSSRRAVPGPGSAAWRTFNKDDVVGIHVRRGGVDDGQSHDEWLTTVAGSPDVVSMAFVPITSLLAGVPGRGYLNHAVNLYLRYKPPIEELEQFLEFQVPRQWAPEFGELPLALGPQRKKKRNTLPSLQFTLMGPKLRVNTAKVDSGGRPVTGIRLFLEGKKNNREPAPPAPIRHAERDHRCLRRRGLRRCQHRSSERARLLRAGQVAAADARVHGAGSAQRCAHRRLCGRGDCGLAGGARGVPEEGALPAARLLRRGADKNTAVRVRRAARRGPEVRLAVGDVQRGAFWHRHRAAAGAARGEGGGELGRVPQGPAGAAARAEDGQVCGHHGTRGPDDLPTGLLPLSIN